MKYFLNYGSCGYGSIQVLDTATSELSVVPMQLVDKMCSSGELLARRVDDKLYPYIPETALSAKLSLGYGIQANVINGVLYYLRFTKSGIRELNLSDICSSVADGVYNVYDSKGYHVFRFDGKIESAGSKCFSSGHMMGKFNLIADKTIKREVAHELFDTGIVFEDDDFRRLIRFEHYMMCQKYRMPYINMSELQKFIYDNDNKKNMIKYLRNFDYSKLNKSKLDCRSVNKLLDNVYYLSSLHIEGMNYIIGALNYANLRGIDKEVIYAVDYFMRGLRK